MKNITKHNTQPSARAKSLVHVRPQLYVASFVGIICLSVCAVSLSGCSGFGTDSFSGPPLSSHPILPAEIPPTAKTVSDLDIEISSEEANEPINQLAQMVGATANSPITAGSDEATPYGPQAVSNPGFRFATELPDEPNFNHDFSPAQLAAPIIHKNAKLIDASTNQTKSVVKLVATTEPIGAGIVVQPNLLSPKPELVPNPLKPIDATPPETDTQPEPKPAPVEGIEVAVGLPPLSATDMHELTRSVVDTPSLASYQSVDLSELELESNLAAKPTPPAPEPQEKSLTATEHLSETIRLIEETVGDTSGLGEQHGADPGVRLLQILHQKMDQVSSSDWRLSAEEHRCWQQQLEAVSVMFESGTAATPAGDSEPQRQTAARTIEHLESAASHLRSIAGLKLYGGQLCSQILGFGKFEELESNEFQPGDRALIYVEIENQSSQIVSGETSPASENRSTFQTRLRASYAVHDSAGKLVHQETYSPIEDLARRHRRDFYLHLPVTIAKLIPGDYKILVSVEDLGNANAATLSAIDFSIIPPTH